MRSLTTFESAGLEIVSIGDAKNIIGVYCIVNRNVERRDNDWGLVQRGGCGRGGRSLEARMSTRST